MRRIAIINQKGGVGKTTTAANLGAALARQGRRVVVIDMDPQANLSLYLGIEVRSGEPSIYGVLAGATTIEQALRGTATPNLRVVPSHIDLSGAELELAGAIGRETLLSDSIEEWEAQGGADYLLIDCPPSLGLLSINALAAAREVIIAVQTEFFALQGLGKLVEVVQLLRKKLNPELEIAGLLPCLYDSRLRLAREVLAELRRYFPGKVYRSSIRSNVKLAESPSYMQSIFEYAPESNGARDYESLALEVIQQETGAPEEPPPPAPDPIADELRATAHALKDADAQPRPFTPEVATPEPVDPAEEQPGLAPEQHVAPQDVAPPEPEPAASVHAQPAPVEARPTFGAGLGQLPASNGVAQAPSTSAPAEVEDEPSEPAVAASDDEEPQPVALEAEPGEVGATEPDSVDLPDASSNGAAAPEPGPATDDTPGAEEPAPLRRSRSANYGAALGEDRPHMAGRFGPRRPLPETEQTD